MPISSQRRDVDSEERGVASPDPKLERTIENLGSTARDACALERNFLSYVRLALLCSLLSSAILLNTRLSGRGGKHEFTNAQVPLGSLYFAASLGSVSAGWWAYGTAIREFVQRKAFIGFKVTEVVIGLVALLVSATCIYLLILES